MKSALIQDLLNVWTANFGGTWEKCIGRPGERDDEYLVGVTELDYCQTIIFNNVKHFLISPNTRVSQPYPNVFSSKEAERLTESEILAILKADPDNT